MFKSLKRVLATASTAALLATNVGVAFAQTFQDVSTDAWYYDYVEQLVDDGVVDAGNKFRPNDSLNRAEMAKLVVTAVDGLADYSAPATPTFDDVPKSAWYYDYVEAAVQLGIVEGYTDASGNLTGKYGPADTLNRAAATKILVNAFAVPTTLNPGSIFPDVNSGAWYYDYAVTAYNQSILDGYDNGKFGPGDVVTRAQVAKLMVNAQNPMERTAGEGEGEGVTPPVNASGALEVSLNDATPASSTLPLSASSVKLATFDLTAADDDVVVSNLVVTRGGVGKAGDWDALYLYEGAKRITTGRTINNDTNTATFAVNLTVDAGTTKSLILVGDVAAAAGASNQHYFYLASAADVTSGALSVAGDFPVAGNTFTMGGAQTVVNTLTVAAGTAPSQPTIGQLDAEVASIKLTAGATNDIAVHQFAITQGGSLSSDKMINLRLLRGTDEVATAAGFDGDRATFVLASPYIIPKGQNKSFYVRADINGGRTTDTIKLYVDETTDVVAIDQQYGYGAVITNNFGSALATTLTLKGGDVTVTDNGPSAKQLAQNSTNNHLLDFGLTAARDLTVRDMELAVKLNYVSGGAAGPDVNSVMAATTTVAAGAGTNTVADFCVALGTNLVVGDTVTVATAGGTVYAIVNAITANDGVNCGAGTDEYIVTNLTTNTTAVTLGGAVTEVDPYTLVKNIKVVDLDSGSTLQGPLTNGTSTTTRVDGNLTTAGDSYMKTMTEDYELVGGETRHIGVLVDTDTNLPAGYSLFASIRLSNGGATSFLKDMAANEFVVTANIVGAGATALQGKQMTTAANSLTVARASIPTSQTYVKGDDKVPALGVAVTSGDAGEITIKKMTVRVVGNAVAGGGVAWVSALGDTAANTLVSSVTLYDGNDVVDGPRSLTLVDAGGDGAFTAGADYYKVLFDNLNLKIAKGSTKTFMAKAKLLNTMSATTYVAIDMVPGTDITAEDVDANTITATGAALNGTTTHNPELTVVTSGSLSASSEGNPDAKNIVAGSTMQLVSKYKFTALREGFNINKLTLMNDAAGVFTTAVATNAVSQVAVKYTDMNGVMQTKTGSLSNGIATLSGLGMFVPAGSDAFVEVYANISDKASVGESISGKSFRIGLQDTNTVSTFEAVGSSSSSTFNATQVGSDVVAFNNPGSVNSFVVRKSVPTFAKASGMSTNLIAGENRLFGLTVTADSLGAVSFGRLSFTVTDGIAAASTISGFKFYRGSTLLSGPTASATGAFIYQGTTSASLADAGTVADTTADAIVSFIQEETVGAGQSQTYYLDATASSAAASGDSIQTKLAIGDEAVPVAGILATSVCGAGNASLCSTGNGNTGLIYDTGANEGLWAVANDFVDLTAAGRAIVWSDKSADVHNYVTGLGAGAITVTAGSGSYDWTNGYLLKTNAVASQTLSR